MLKQWQLMVGLLLALGWWLPLPQPSLAQEPAPTDNFIFINYIGQTLTLDLDDVTYTVPGIDVAPEGGELTLQLAPGEHKFAASVPGVLGEAGTFVLTPGETVAKAARLDQTAPAIDRDGTLLKEPQDIVDVFDFDPFAQPVETTPVVDTWQPEPAVAGQASLVWINYIGDELTVDLNGQIYKVAPPSNEIPGRLQLDLPPGEYTYSASVPAGSTNGRFSLAAGQVVGLTAVGTPLEEREYEVGERYDPLLPIAVTVTQEDLTAQAATPTPLPSPAEAPATVPAADNVEPAPAVETPVAAPALRVKNYAGETLTFTIDNQAYSISNNEELNLDLPPGEYTYTASLPSRAVNGTVLLQPGQPVELSVAIDFAANVLSVYGN
ncbi:MAG TPA: hypothetical protein PKE64_30030 [Anaerolineae bacterium]|nr:hypothetical protein [Anaerolineae bacterium]HMR68271.1 hypothetical protein [Anaerolineae bacterium]